MKPQVSTPDRGLRSLGARPAAMAFVIGLVALSASASETELVRGIQRYCAACWRNAHIDPGIWDDCTQEVCCRLLAKARSGDLDLPRVFADESPERRELVRAIDMVRKRVQRSRKHEILDERSLAVADRSGHVSDQIELGELLHNARLAVLSPRQDRILELWSRGHSVPDISSDLGLPEHRVSDEKYKALRKLQRYLARDEAPASSTSPLTG